MAVKRTVMHIVLYGEVGTRLKILAAYNFTIVIWINNIFTLGRPTCNHHVFNA